MATFDPFSRISISGPYEDENYCGSAKAKDVFEQEVSQLVEEFGIGWKIENGFVQARVEERYKNYLRMSESPLVATGRNTALTEPDG